MVLFHEMKLYFKTEDCLLFLKEKKTLTINLYFLFLALKKKGDIVYFYVGLTYEVCLIKRFWNMT